MCKKTELQKLFASMAVSEFSSSDPNSLVEALEIDPRVQQDPHEFARLFLQKKNPVATEEIATTARMINTTPIDTFVDNEMRFLFIFTCF